MERAEVGGFLSIAIAIPKPSTLYDDTDLASPCQSYCIANIRTGQMRPAPGGTKYI